MSGDELDLDAIEARWALYAHDIETARYDDLHEEQVAADVPALVAEVRRLRDDLTMPPDGEDRTAQEYLVWAVPHWRKRARAAEAEVRRLREQRDGLLDFAASVEKTGDPIRPHEIREALTP